MRFGIETQRYGQRFEITVQFVVTSAQLSFKLKKKIAYICAIFFCAALHLRSYSF